MVSGCTGICQGAWDRQDAQNWGNSFLFRLGEIFNIKHTWIHYRGECKMCTKFQTKTEALKQISREIMARRFRLCCPNHQQQCPNPRLMSLFSCSLLDHWNTSSKSLRSTAGTDCIHHKHSPISHRYFWHCRNGPIHLYLLVNWIDKWTYKLGAEKF